MLARLFPSTKRCFRVLFAVVLGIGLRGCDSFVPTNRIVRRFHPHAEYSFEFVKFGVASSPNVDFDQESSASALMQLGTNLQREGRLLESLASFQRAADLDPEYGEAKLQVGKAFAAMGYIDEAEAAFREILSRPAFSHLHRWAKLFLANLLLDGRGEKAGALEVYREGFDAGRPGPLTVLAGIVADSLGDHAAALQFYRASELDQDTALHLTTSLARAGNDDESTLELRSRLPEHLASSCDYVLSSPVGLNPSTHFYTYDMLELAFQHCSSSSDLSSVGERGLILEFGVFHGKTIRMIASHFSEDDVHGFDTFSGIPEDWHNTKQGSYSTHGELPPAPDNVQYHVGLFSETLPGFLKAHPGRPIRLMNIDCDLYSSTKDVFDAVHDRVVPGTIIVFDEYVMNPHWKDDEYRAFEEAVDKYGWKYEYLGISLVSQQAVVRIL